MDGMTVGVAVASIALFTFLLALYQGLKKDIQKRVDKLEANVKVLEESKTRTEQRFIQVDKDKRAADIVVRGINDKLDKIYDFLIKAPHNE